MEGLFEFNAMPFGLSNTPAVFQGFMSVVLQCCNDFATACLENPSLGFKYVRLQLT